MQAKERIILALDVDTGDEALRLVDLLKDQVGFFKIGMQLFNSEGPQIVEKVNALGGRIFVDLKFHDIPNTVAAAARVITRLGCHMFNVHAAGGSVMMKDTARAVAEEATRTGKEKPIVLAVTVLTSLSNEQVEQELKSRLPVDQLVVEWAKMARDAGLDGVVASPREVEAIRAACGKDFLIVTPGVRPLWSETGDQKRVTTPADAVKRGSDYLVIGRPITAADDPVAAAIKITKELEEL